MIVDIRIKKSWRKKKYFQIKKYNERKFGLMDTTGVIKFEYEYDELIEQDAEGRWILHKEGNIQYIDEDKE